MSQITLTNKEAAYNRKYNLTIAQIKALRSVFGKGWTQLTLNAIKTSLVTMGK